MTRRIRFPYITGTWLTGTLLACVWICAFTISLSPAVAAEPVVQEDSSNAAITALEAYLAQDDSDHSLEKILAQPFADAPLSKADAEKALKLLTEHHQQKILAERREELAGGVLTEGELKMPIYYKSFGEKPAEGWSLYISMHGGGGAPARVNDGQWENQKRLYSLEEGIYAVPRAPTNTWNLWHQDHIDVLFDRLIEDLVVVEGVNWNRVYLMGYSAGGDGVYQLAPRMADRFAAASMMAGHPNETSPLGLRNLPFALQVGGNDSAYNRNQIGRDWEKKLAELQQSDSKGYNHFVKIYEGKGHWMDREDAVAIPWMAKFTRNPVPTKIVWKQDDVLHTQFYWLQVTKEQAKAGALVNAQLDGQTITLQSTDVETISVLLDDRLLDLDNKVTIVVDGKPVFDQTVPRKIRHLATCLQHRGDPNLAFSAAVEVSLASTADSQ